MKNIGAPPRHQKALAYKVSTSGIVQFLSNPVKKNRITTHSVTHPIIQSHTQLAHSMCRDSLFLLRKVI